MKADTPASTGGAVGREIFEKELATIQRVIDFVASRRRLGPTEREDFGSYVMLKLIEDDYRRIRDFRGASRFETYLNVVIPRLLLDYRARQWGKWRPSARARALGEQGVLVERLLYRDGLSRTEVSHALEEHGVSMVADVLDSIICRLPYRPRRRQAPVESVDQLPDVLDPVSSFDPDSTAAAQKMEAALDSALQELAPEDRVVLKLRFIDGCTVRETAAALGLQEPPLYRRIQRIYRTLRLSLERRGVRCEEARAVWSDRMDIDVGSAFA
jgi:RNA polymerase sigma factor (sigma-70 family)